MVGFLNVLLGLTVEHRDGQGVVVVGPCFWRNVVEKQDDVSERTTVYRHVDVDGVGVTLPQDRERVCVSPGAPRALLAWMASER